MNSPMKDALTEFINNNTSVLQQAMDSGRQDLTKDVPAIPDLVNYLSCPSPQPCNKELDAMSTSQQAQAHSSSFDSLAQQHLNSPHRQDIPDTKQFSSGEMCDPVLNQVSSLTQHELQQQQCLSHHNMFDHNTVAYPDAGLELNKTSCAFPDTSTTFSGSSGSSSSTMEIHSALGVPASESQYGHTAGQTEYCITSQFQVAADVNKHDHQTQFMNTDSCVVNADSCAVSSDSCVVSSDSHAAQFQTRSDTSSSGFQESSVLSSSFTSSVNSDVGYGQDGLGFALLSANADSLNSLDSMTGQFRAAEKMHVDEPDMLYPRQATAINHFQPVPTAHASSSDVHMQAYSSDPFVTQVFAGPQQATSIANAHLQNCPSSMVDQFNSSGFQQSPAAVEPCTDFHTQSNLRQAKDVLTDQTDYLPQPSQTSDSSESSFSGSGQHVAGSSHPGPYQGSQFFSSASHCSGSANVAETFQKSVVDMGSAAVTATCNQSHQLDHITHSPDSSHYQHQSPATRQPHQLDHITHSPDSSHYQHQSPATRQPHQLDHITHSPDSSHYQHQSPAPRQPDHITHSPDSSHYQHQSPAARQPHQLDHITHSPDSSHYQHQSPAARQPHQLDLSKFHQNSSLDISYGTEVGQASCPDQQPIGFHSSVTSNLSNPVLFPTPVPAAGENTPDYLGSSVSAASAQVNEHSAFIGASSSESSILSAINQASGSQSAADFQMSTSPGQDQRVTDGSKTTPDVTMRDFSLDGSLHSPPHVRFTDESFIHLDFEAVVSSLNVDTHRTSTELQNDPILNSVAFPSHYDSYEYGNLTPASTVSFPGMSHPATDSNTFTEHSKSEFTSCTPTLSTATFVSESLDQNANNQFGSSNFGFSSTQEMAAQPTYHQPMQVQDSEPQVVYPYPSSNAREHIVNNTETAMDVSASLGDKASTGLGSGISYEDIHMSIVKAGNELSKNANQTEILDAHGVYSSSQSQTASLNSVDNVSGIFSTSSTDIYPAEKSEPGVGTSYSTGAPNSALMTASGLPDNMQHDASFSSQISACSNSSSSQLPDSVSSSSLDTNIFSDMLSDLQPSSSSGQLVLEGVVTQPATATVPNFLENPGTLVSAHQHPSSDAEGMMSAASVLQGQSQNNFIISVSAVLPPSISKSLAASPNMSQSGVGGRQLASSATSQQPQAQAVSTLAGSGQMFGTVNNTAQVTATSFLGHLETGVADQGNSSLPTNQVMQTAGMVGTSVASTAPGTFLHMTSPQGDRIPVLPASTAGSTHIQSNTSHKFATTTIVAGLASNPSPSQGSSASKQSHIIVSLEELQKLLAQQNLSQTSVTVSQQQQQPYTSLSSPQTLVLQKHASHSLKQSQSQPRLLIKGTALPGQPRLAHPHQQLQQTREKLQLLMHQSQAPDQTSLGSLSQRSLEQNVLPAGPESQQKVLKPFQFVSISQLEQLPQTKVQVVHSSLEQQQQPKVRLQLKPAQLFQQQQQSPTANLLLQQVSKTTDHKLTPRQLGQSLQLVLPQSQQKSVADHKPFVHIESHFQNSASGGGSGGGSQKNLSGPQKSHNLIQLAQMQQELLSLLKQEEKGQEFENQQLHHFHRKQQQQQLQPLEKSEKPDRTCSDSLKKDYRHLHSLLIGESTGCTQTKVLPPMLNLAATNSQGQTGLQLGSGGISGNMTSVTLSQPLSSITSPFSFISVNNSSFLQPTTASSSQSSSSLSTLAFVKNQGTSADSKSADIKDFGTDTSIISSQPWMHVRYAVKSETIGTDHEELETSGGSNHHHLSTHQPAPLTLTSTERKRSHTPLSVDLNSPANSSSEAGSPLSSPTVCEDGNTQLTLIERSADLHIKSDSILGVDDDDAGGGGNGEADDNSSFDLNAFHKRPSAGECHSNRGKTESVPMKIAKSSIDTNTHSAVSLSTSPESTFDFGSAATSASGFSFVFGNKEDHNSEVFTFGLNGAVTTSTTATTTAMTTETLPHKDGGKSFRLGVSKPVLKTAGMRATVPTQPVRPTTRKQKEHSLKAYYPSKLEAMELKILEQPEPQHRARYQTEGSRGAIKDASQQGFPVIKLFGYSKPAKLQVFIGDECGRVKPHGFYQACRVFGKNSTACTEQEIEDTTVIEIEMLPENDMTVKLDCVGILKLRNADVERRIGPKRAREKKKTNTRARLVMRCLVEKSDGNPQILQVVSNPIVCTQPVGQPEISRMSLSEASVVGGDSLFIIGKNFKNKGTSVWFQQLDTNEEHVVWQMEAEIEQEFFQPTHLICKVPPYKDASVAQPQLAQIVISCAGKRSDPQTFMYKPVYPVASSSMKHNVPMDTDLNSTSPPASFVSPEALHLNRMLHLSSAHATLPSTSTSIMFQLPPGSLAGRQTQSATVGEPASNNISSQLIVPTKLLDHAVNTASMVGMTPSTTASTATSNPASTSSQQAPPTSFLLEEKFERTAMEMPKDSLVRSAVQSSSMSGATQAVFPSVHSNSDTSAVPAVSYAVSDSQQQPSLTSSASAGHVINSSKLPANSKSASLPNKPFFLVVDPVALQSNVGNEKIQQLLQHILDAQSKAW